MWQSGTLFLAGLSRNGGSTNIPVDPLGPPIFSSFHSDPRTVSEQLPEIMWWLKTCLNFWLVLQSQNSFNYVSETQCVQFSKNIIKQGNVILLSEIHYLKSQLRHNHASLDVSGSRRSNP